MGHIFLMVVMFSQHHQGHRFHHPSWILVHNVSLVFSSEKQFQHSFVEQLQVMDMVAVETVDPKIDQQPQLSSQVKVRNKTSKLYIYLLYYEGHILICF